MILILLTWIIFSVLMGVTSTILVMAVAYVIHEAFSMFMQVIETYEFDYSGYYAPDCESKPEIDKSTKDLIDKISRGPEEEGAGK